MVQGQNPDTPSVSSEPTEPVDAEPEKEQESPERLDKKEKKIIKKKSPFLPGNFNILVGLDILVGPLLLFKRLDLFVEGSDSIYLKHLFVVHCVKTHFFPGCPCP